MEVHTVNEQGAIDPSEMFVVNETDKTGNETNELILSISNTKFQEVQDKKIIFLKNEITASKNTN